MKDNSCRLGLLLILVLSLSVFVAFAEAPQSRFDIRPTDSDVPPKKAVKAKKESVSATPKKVAPVRKTETPPSEAPAAPSAHAKSDPSTFRSPTLNAKFVLIPAGTFMMGSPSGEPGRDNDETQHQVTISKSFYMQTTEVTQGQWKTVIGWNPSDFKKCGKDCPVESVSWNDAQEFIRKLNQKEGTDKYRLPTEAEWEYAARAGTIDARSGALDEIAWYDKNSDGKTHPVGQKRPNAWGLNDMYGNVWEWVHDWYGEYPTGPVTDPIGPESRTRRVFRGASCYDDTRYCRSARRKHLGPIYRLTGVGFRLVRTQETAADKVTEKSTEKKPISQEDASRVVAPASPAASYTSPMLNAKFVLIPPGTFMMGSPPNEPGRHDDETQHQVTISKPYYMQTTEVTQGQWKAVMENNPSYFKKCGDGCPVECVSWNNVQEFINKLNKVEGTDKYRLPTEAEWEYAARAGTMTALYNGPLRILDQMNGPALDSISWYGGNSGVSYADGFACSHWSGKQYRSSRCGPHLAGLKSPNAWGLYDMLGNVDEWVQDRTGDYQTGPVTDPTGQVGCSRVLRGCGWSGFASDCRAARRFGDEPSLRFFDRGFRLARTL